MRWPVDAKRRLREQREGLTGAYLSSALDRVPLDKQQFSPILEVSRRQADTAKAGRGPGKTGPLAFQGEVTLSSLLPPLSKFEAIRRTVVCTVKPVR